MKYVKRFIKVGLVCFATVVALFLNSCFGLVAVDKYGVNEYAKDTQVVLEEWKSVINDWEKAADDPERLPYLDIDADIASQRMDDILVSWDSIVPPDELREYHLWMRHAMDYERESFRIMAEYYRLGEGSDPAEVKRLRNLATELMIMKDKALLKADEAIRK